MERRGSGRRRPRAMTPPCRECRSVSTARADTIQSSRPRNDFPSKPRRFFHPGARSRMRPATRPGRRSSRRAPEAPVGGQSAAAGPGWPHPDRSRCVERNRRIRRPGSGARSSPRTTPSAIPARATASARSPRKPAPQWARRSIRTHSRPPAARCPSTLRCSPTTSRCSWRRCGVRRRRINPGDAVGPSDRCRYLHARQVFESSRHR